MNKKQSFSNEYIIHYLNTNYDINVSRLTLIPLGADIDAFVYQADTVDQLSYFVKLRRSLAQDVTVKLQLLLHTSSIKEVIAPLITYDGQLTYQIEDYTLTVYPFIEGQDGFHTNLTDNQWVDLGQTLRKVHNFDVPSSLKKEIKQEDYSSKWRVFVRNIYRDIDTEYIVTDDIALKLTAFMKEHKEVVHRLIDRAEHLAEKVQKLSPQLVFCHSDIHAGNVLLADNGAIYIVDWDQPMIAPKEHDLMFIGGGVGNVWNKPYEEELFYKGYGQTKINKEILAYYRHERIVQDIAEYAQQLLLTTDGGKNREIMYLHFLNMFEPQGVVEIAFKTDTTI